MSEAIAKPNREPATAEKVFANDKRKYWKINVRCELERRTHDRTCIAGLSRAAMECGVREP